MHRASVALLIALSWCASVVAQNTTYNSSDTFQPGRKYNCVPSADRKGWDCNEIGKADKPAADASSEAAPSAPSAHETKPEQPTPAVTPAAPQSTQSPSTDRSSSLPNYLTNAAANSAAPPPPPSTISATANHANEPPIQSTPPSPSRTKPPVVAKPAPVAAPTKAPAVTAKTPVPKSRPAAIAPPKPSAPARETPRPAIPANGDFMNLAGDRFVIELGHASRQADLNASRDALHVPRGDLYEVHLRQNGADAWLLLWGTFDTIEAARSARGELAQGTAATVGWPRRVAPLQAEARRVAE